MKDWLRRNVRWVAPVAVVLAVFAGWLAFGYFGFQTILFDDEVNEDLPVFASGAAQPETSTVGEAGSDDTAANDETTVDSPPTEDPSAPTSASSASRSPPPTEAPTWPPRELGRQR